MPIEKKVFPALDAAPSVIYAHEDSDNEKAYPVTSSGGTLRVTDTAVVNAINNIVVPAPAGGATSVKQDSERYVLRAILDALLFPSSIDMATMRQRGTVIVESGTVVTSSTINTVAGYPANDLVIGPNLTAWAMCCRERIS